MTITEFLEARIAEDEAVARFQVQRMTQPADGGSFDLVESDEYSTIDITPARVLAECAAKRKILALEICNACEVEYQPCDHRNGTLSALSAVYVSHPDYLEGWAL
ncbi:DUF6221 family protein [Pseudarthrobacter sp. PS3-L1]|uniref:DUF6221 family protein n=1 Tax=Pseudarthrobacter sp. PS3-L1 TaxID=3046207 RepID=UPI0024BB26B4|nr:DUF6221 family protein [Pseudarthrobacter sp. PS3-L1]MDJ0321642.1 DUF6221 family protein [Pseudarthrobacter sp. PS3-L1]